MLSVTEAREKLDQKQILSVELAEQCLSAIKQKDEDIHAFLGVFDDVLEQAKAADERISKGEGTALTGIPIALKDNIVQEGRHATAGSHMLEHFVSPYDATVTKKLKDAGAVLIGRTNLDEFAMGSSTEHSAFGVTKNPHDTSRVPGGSSGGSAAAVAAGFVPASIGSDTGGSIRQPASYCGVVGLKPTYGSVSRHGLMAMGSSLDVIGPLTNTIDDAKVLYDAMKGVDPLDSTSREGSVEVKKKFRIGIPKHLLAEGINEDVSERFEESVTCMQAAGHDVVEVELPRAAHALAVYYVIMPAEVSTNLSRYDGVRFGHFRSGSDGIDDYLKSRSAFGEEARRRMLLGTYVLSAGYYDAYYHKATAVRRLITADFDEAFKEVDVIATPTAPAPAFKIGEKSDPLSMYLSDIFTVPANLTGMPALSTPIGTVERDGSALPVGLQLTAPHFAEDWLFAVGKSLV